ncbi:MAG: cyclic nucleotide-binding domain-containing protein [Chloroflexi bacterium]|nr:cyclic nucleotide-binding domain-containing protein [Chloroflexota bacterium]
MAAPRDPDRSSSTVESLLPADLALSAGEDVRCGSPTIRDLRAVPLFASLSEENLAQLARGVRKRQATRGEALCREGERGDEMYVVLDGMVTVVKTADGHETELGQFESGAHFGEMALIGDAPRSATIRAASDVEYLALDRTMLMRVIAAYPTVALEILRGYNTRLAETTDRLARLTADRAPAGGLTPTAPPAPQPEADGGYVRALEQIVRFGPHPLAVLARRLQVEAEWNRKVLLALDVFELSVKYTIFLLLADYLRRPDVRTPDLDQMVLAAFRRPTLGLLLDLHARVLRGYAAQQQEPFVRELYTQHFDVEGRRSEGVRAYQALTAYRNRLKHGAEGVWDDEVFRADFEGIAVANPMHRASPTAGHTAGERGVGIRQHLTAVLESAAFLRDYPLVFLTSMTFEHGTFEYGYERCTGAYASFDRGVFPFQGPLENRRLFALSERDGQVLRLDPLLRRQRCPGCAAPAIFLLFNAAVERERPPRGAKRPAGDTPASADGDGPGDGGPDPSVAEDRRRRKEKLEYLSYVCGHTITETLGPERIERGEGLSPLFK